MSRIYVYSFALFLAVLLAVSLEAAGQTILPVAQANLPVPVPVPPLLPEPPTLLALQYRSVILAVSVNGLPIDLGAVFLLDKDGHLFAPASFLNDINLRSSGLYDAISLQEKESKENFIKHVTLVRSYGAAAVVKAFDEQGQAVTVVVYGVVYFDLTRIQGLSYSWNHELEELSITVAPDAFMPTNIDIGADVTQNVVPYAPGGYLNYYTSLTHTPEVTANQTLFNVGLFRGEGLLTSSFTTGTAGSARLMSTYQTDRIDELKSLRIGDSYNNTGAWGRGVLFGGIQYGTDFSVRPDFVSMSMPSVSGKALLPSTVDIYVDNVLRTRQQVNSGPFSIQNLPVITGAGEVQIVVKDLLGREQMITQPFFASPSLLREGLVEDSYELGWLRQNFGQMSNDYSDPFVTMNYRKGLTNQVTGEGRIELQKGLVAYGGSAAAMLPVISSVIESSVAFSNANGLSPGMMTRVNYSYLGQRWSASARTQLNSLSFRQLGSDPANLPRRISAVQVSTPLSKGALSANYLLRENQGENSTRVINLNYSQRLSRDVFESFTLLKTLSTSTGSAAWITLTMIFDQSHFGGTTLKKQSGATSLYTEFQQSTPSDEGTGYRLAAMNGSGSRQEASVTRNQSFGSFQADLISQNGRESSRLTANGGIASLGDGVFFSRGLEESFAIVQTRDMPGVPIFLENQVATHTDSHGRAMVSNLRPYMGNRISIDPLTLPLESSINEVEKNVVPRRQGGAFVDFEVRKVRSATLKIILANGKPLPAWTPVEVVGMDQVYVSGNRGEVFVDLPNLKNNRVIARPAGGSVCELTIDQPDSALIVPFLGPFTCKQSD